MKLELAEALLRIGCLPDAELPKLATSMLESGIDTPSLRRLAGLIQPELDSARDLFSRVLAELDRPPVTPDDAAWRVAADLAQAVLDGRLSPRQAASSGAQLAIALNYHDAFMALYSADDMYGLSFWYRGDVDKSVRQWAQDTQQRHSRHAV